MKNEELKKTMAAGQNKTTNPQQIRTGADERKVKDNLIVCYILDNIKENIANNNYFVGFLIKENEIKIFEKTKDRILKEIDNNINDLGCLTEKELIELMQNGAEEPPTMAAEPTQTGADEIINKLVDYLLKEIEELKEENKYLNECLNKLYDD